MVFIIIGINHITAQRNHTWTKLKKDSEPVIDKYVEEINMNTCAILGNVNTIVVNVTDKKQPQSCHYVLCLHLQIVYIVHMVVHCWNLLQMFIWMLSKQ